MKRKRLSWEPIFLVLAILACQLVAAAVPSSARAFQRAGTPEDAIFAGINRGDLETVAAAIRAGANLNALSYNKRTPVMLAAEFGRAEILRVLLEAGADPHIVDEERGNAMVHAGWGGSLEVIQLLLEAGLDVNSTSGTNETAVARAAAGGRADAIRALVNAGATGVNLPTTSGFSPVFQAINSGKAGAVRALLENGADPNQRTVVRSGLSGGDSPLKWAVYKGVPEIVAALLKGGASADPADQASWGIYWAAGKNKRIEILRLLFRNAERYEHHHARLLGLLASESDSTVVQSYLQAGLKFKGTDEDGGALFTAVWRGHVDKVRNFLDLGAHVEVRDDLGRTPLFRANQIRNRKKRLEIIALLLEAGADITAEDRFSGTVLHDMSFRPEADVDTAKAYIQAGAEVNARSQGGSTPLHTAARSGKPALVDLYIDSGANLEARNSSGETPLMVTAHRGEAEILKLLIERGANINATTKFGNNALMIALSEQGVEDEVVDPSERARALIESGIELSHANSEGLTALDLALRRRLDDVAELIKERAQAGQTQIPASGASLLAAAAGGDAETVAKMIREGADVNFTGQRDLTPAHAAAGSGVVGSIRALAAAGADFNRQDSSGYLPLNFAVKRNDVQKIRALLQGGADPNGKDRLGFSILSRALNRRTNIDTIRALIEGGADVNTPSRKFDLPPIFGAVGTGDREKVQLLIDSGAVVKAEVGYRNLYAHAGSIEMLQLLFKYTGTPEMDSEIAHDLVRSKAQSGNIKLLKFLIDAGAEVEPSVPGRHTPLMGAARDGHVEAVRFLLEAGANVNAVEKYRGRTVLMEAAEILQFKEKKGVATVRLLLEAGADPSVKDKSGMTALKHAEEKGNKEIAEIIKAALR